MHVYPAIDILEGHCVRLRQGDYSQSTVFHNDPVAVAQEWIRQGADRLHLVDLDGAKAGKPVNEAVVRRIVDSVPVPCQLGGGIRTKDDLRSVFGWGVQWAVVGTKALSHPQWLCDQAAEHPGRIVLGVDAREGMVAVHGWTKTSSLTAVELVRRVEASPLFAVVFTDIAKDGMMAGPNHESLLEMKWATRLPVIASGGVSDLNHIARLAAAGHFGAIVGRALYERTFTLTEALAAASPMT
jgi:phosphoribosylformimino-5-aminoimidazole carboxamide ribotide isomerase